MYVNQQPLYAERTAGAPAGAGAKCRAAAVARRAGSRAARPDDTGGECRRGRRRSAGRTAGVRDPVMQDQLLAESKAAVPAEMVREFQVAGLGQQRCPLTFHVMPGLVPGIPFRDALCLPKRDRRDKPGNDSRRGVCL